MNQGEGSGLPPAGQSYPSPTPQQMGVGGLPYYGNQHQLSPEEAQLQQQLSGAVRSTMAEGMNNGQNMMGPGGEYGDQTSSPPMAQVQYDANQQGGSDLNHDLSFGDQSARRKRSKVSRACDECRRKKIRCDATNESGVDRCSNCQRTNLQCQFSRVPMKRGPSKGYIKELAERLNSLENQMQPIQPMPPGGDMQYQGVNDDGSPHGYEQYSPVDAGSLSRKRTFSMAAEATYPGQFQQRDRMPSMGSFSNQGQPGQAYQTQRPSFSGPDPLPQPNPEDIAPPFWFKGGMNPTALEIAEGVQTNPDFDWDNDSIEAYYKSIHELLPILHHSRTDLRSHLTKCSLTLRDTFLNILYSTVKVAPKGNEENQADDSAMTRAFEVLRASQYEDPKNRPLSVNVIYLQCMILASLEVDQRGPDNLRGKNGTPKVQLLQMAIGLGHALVKQSELEAPRQLEVDRDSIKNLIRRNWMILVVLDRFNALSTGTMKIIAQSMTKFNSVDKPVLGETLYYLADLTDVMSQLTSVIEMQKSPSGLPIFKDPHSVLEVLESSLERVPRMEGRYPPQNADQVSGNPNFDTIGLLWWHLHLLLKRHLYIMHPRELLPPSKIIVDILKNQTSSGPFHIHFYALASITFLELADVPDCADEAWKGISDLLEALNRRRSVPSVQSSPPQSPKTTNGKAANKSTAKDAAFILANTTPGWDDAIRNLVMKKKQQNGYQFPRPGSAHQSNQVKSSASGANAPTTEAGRSLQQLADLAEKVGGNSSGDVQEDSGPSTGAAGGGNEGKVSGTGAGTENAAIDFTMLTKIGYLSVLA